MSSLQEKDGAGPIILTPQRSEGSEKHSRKEPSHEFEHVQHNEKRDAEIALNGDDSDGKIDWSSRQIITTVSLALVYVGKENAIFCISI